MPSQVETTLRWELERERKAGGKLMSRTEAEAVCSRITGRTSELIDSAIAPARERSNGRPDHVSMRFVEHRSQYELQFESERLHINTEHYDKLKKRYKKHTEDFADSDAAASATFHRRLFNLLCRCVVALWSVADLSCLTHLIFADMKLLEVLATKPPSPSRSSPTCRNG